MPRTLDLPDFETRMSRALHELVPEFDDSPPANVRPMRRHHRRWVVGASIVAVAAAAAAIVVAVMPGDREPNSAPPAGHPSVTSPSTATPTASCTRLQPHAGALRDTGASAAEMTVRLTSATGCVLRTMPVLALELSTVSTLTVPPATAARLPLTIPAGGSVVVEVRYLRLATSGTSPRDWRFTVRVGAGPAGSAGVTFPLRPGYTPIRYVLTGISS